MNVPDGLLSWFLAGLALLSAAIVWLMLSAGVVDQPDARKAHDRPTPKGGGAGVVAAVVVGATVAAVTGGAVFHPLALVAAAGLAVLALLDDVRDFRFTVKLGAQIVAAALAVASGLVVHTVSIPGLGTWTLGWWAIPVTFGWILFTTNAVNFIDGLNGLAAGSSLLACVVVAALLPPGHPALAVCLWLAAGLAGFLPFNYPRARIFMGDVGSQFCGYLLAILSVSAAGSLPALTGPLLLSGILFDVLFTLCRRALARQRVWEPHRGHLYQVASRSGVPAPLVAIVHWMFVIWGAFCASLLTRGSVWAIPLVLAPQAVWTAAIWTAARRAGVNRW